MSLDRIYFQTNMSNCACAGFRRKSCCYSSELSIFAPNVGYYELLERGDVAQLTSVPFAEVLSIFRDGAIVGHVTNFQIR